MTTVESTLTRFVRGGWALIAGLAAVGGTLVVMAAWIVPVEAVQNWAIDPESTDPYSLYETMGMVEAAHWSAQWLAPLVAIAGFRGWRRRTLIVPVIEATLRSFWQLTSQDGPPSKLGVMVSLVKRAALLAVLILAISHWGAGLKQRLKDWPYYRFHSSDEVLPNISESNRDVIHYLRSSTPENARIFVVSDQKLFFLSYHLRPRSLYHRMHPTAEHLIPRAHQARQLAAYRLHELPPDVWECQPDYVLEYFEGAEYVDPARTLEDRQWVSFLRQRTGDATKVPEFVVVLHRWPLTEVQP